MKTIQEKIKKTYQMMECHPTFRKHFRPQVQVFWDMFPFDFFMFPTNKLIDLCLMPFAW